MYTSATEIAALVPQPVTASTNPNLAEVGVLIGEVSARVESAAAYAGYAVPIVSPSDGGASAAYLAVVGIVKHGVVWQTMRRMFPNISEADKSNLATESRDAYNAALEALRLGQITLPGAGRETGAAAVLPRGWTTSNPGASSAQPDVSWGRQF